jgi:putative FmdB family regulatory protein
MPTYEYACKACGHQFEEFQSMSAKPLRKCPECGKQQLERLIGAGAGLIFKGGGFYETDYRSESYKKSADAEKKQTSGEGDSSKSKPDGSGSKAESKPEAAKPAAAAKPESAAKVGKKPAPKGE